jgi:hypothetical protein
MTNTEYQSEAAQNLKHRFEKNRDRLFTFLHYDDVPWHNNNAEHAVKAFARLRCKFLGQATPKAISEYLVLLSLCQTCIPRRGLSGFPPFRGKGRSRLRGKPARAAADVNQPAACFASEYHSRPRQSAVTDTPSNPSRKRSGTI